MDRDDQPRRYYSARTGKRTHDQFDLATLKGLFQNAWSYFTSNGFFDEHLGSWCVDEGNMPGLVGANVGDYVILRLRRKGLWPIADHITEWDEPDLFDMIEFLHDHVSKPVEGTYHSFSGCGYHWSKFDRVAGQCEYRERLNLLLDAYGEGFLLNKRGEIMRRAPTGLSKLLTATLATNDCTVEERVQSAVDRFQRYGSNIDDRQKAVRDLADVLEWLRPQIKTALLKDDESDLFNIANIFGIRHLNKNQKLAYDKAVWLSWMFYHYLATINAALHLIQRQRVVPREIVG